MTQFSVQELGPRTWPDFERIVEKHNGVWGGCWCVTFHHPTGKGTGTAAGNRALKQKLVMAGKSHAALAYDGASTASSAWTYPTGESRASSSTATTDGMESRKPR